MKPKLMRTGMNAGLVAALLVIQLGCAMMDRNNTPVLNWVDKKLDVPSGHPLTEAAVFPLAFTTGVLAFTADAFILHPASVIDDAARATDDALWNVTGVALSIA